MDYDRKNEELKAGEMKNAADFLDSVVKGAGRGVSRGYIEIFKTHEKEFGDYNLSVAFSVLPGSEPWYIATKKVIR